MTVWHAYDYALLRLVPHPADEAFETVGVVLHVRTQRFLVLRYRLDPARLAALGVDPEGAASALAACARIAEGAPSSGPIGLLPPSERFHWLTAPRSTVLQPSPVRAGRTRDPAATLARLCAETLRP